MRIRAKFDVLMATAVSVFLMTTGALAFGPPAAVVTDASAQRSTTRASGQDIVVNLESAVPEGVAWKVMITTSAGWSATSAASSVSLASAMSEDPIGTLPITLTPLDATCPPDGLVLQVRLVDPTGDETDVTERLYYVRSEDGLQPIGYETYLAIHESIDAGHSSAKECMTAKSAVASEAWKGGGQQSLLTVSRYLFGYVYFWDARGNRSAATGSRLATCNAADTDCSPGPGCCWRPLPNAKVLGYRGSGPPGTYLGEMSTSSSGFFVKLLSAEPESSYYYMVVRAETLSNFSGARVRVKVGGTPATLQTDSIFSDDVLADFGNQIVNAGGDTTSTAGDAFTAFVAANEAFAYLDEEGETRHQISGAFWEIYPTSGSNYADCDDENIYVQAAYSRELEFVHLLGFGYMGAVTGCSGNNPAYPKYHPGGYDRYTAEGNALRVGIPSLLVTLSRYDPDSASTTDIFSSLYSCRGNSYDNANLASDERNNWHGLWELVDTDEGNTSGDGADYVDLTVKDVMDGLTQLQENDGDPGDQYSSDEQILTEVPYSVCFSADHCDDDDACVGYICYEGDPHGENIWDLAYNVCAFQEESDTCSGLGQLVYGWTIMSSPCLGAYDNDYEYTGGFHLD